MSIKEQTYTHMSIKEQPYTTALYRTGPKKDPGVEEDGHLKKSSLQHHSTEITGTLSTCRQLLQWCSHTVAIF